MQIVGRIRMRLEENERENITRLMKIKDMAVKEKLQDPLDLDDDEENFSE